MNILAILQMPPPIHGTTVMNQNIKESKRINEAFDIDYIALCFSKKIDKLGKFGLLKLFKGFKYSCLIFFKLFVKKYDLIYFTLTPVGSAFYRDAFFVSIMKLFSVKRVYHLHGKGIEAFSKAGINNLLYKYVFAHAKIILLSEALYQDIEKYVEKDKCYFLPNGIDVVARKRPNVAANKDESRPIRLLYLSTLTRQKGIIDFLEAMKILKVDSNIKIKASVAGEFSYGFPENEFWSIVKRDNMENEITYLGGVYGSGKQTLYETSDIFVFPTHNEAFGLVLLEAMGYGLPIVVTSDGAIPELIENGINGFLVEKNSPSEVANKIRCLSSDPLRRLKMSKANIKKFQENYTFGTFEDNFINTMTSVLGADLAEGKKFTRILVGIPNPDARGGLLSCEPYLLEYLKSKEHTKVSTVVYGSPRDQVSFWHRIINTARMSREMTRMAKSENYDIIHINTAYNVNGLLRDVFIVLLLKFTRIRAKLFLKFHGSNAVLLSGNLGWRLITLLLLNNVNGVGFLSKEERNNFLIVYPEQKEKFYIVKNVVNSIRFELKSNFREKHKISSQKTILLFIARFVESKGILQVIKAFSIVKKRFTGMHLLLVGDGEMMKAAKELVATLELEKDTTFTGYVEEIDTPEIYLGSDILVFPTVTEGFSMTIFNSAAAGLPIITSRIRAAADYLNEPDNCLWVEPKNCDMLIERMSYLLNHPQLAEKMKINNRKLAKQFSRKSVGEEFLNIYSKI